MRILAIEHERDGGPGVFAEGARMRSCELVRWRIAEGERCPQDLSQFGAVLTLGGSMDADQLDRHPWLEEEHRVLGSLIEAGMPVLGVCLGAQVLARAGGAETRRMAEPEIGWHEVRLTEAGRGDPLLGALGSAFEALQWHSCAFSVPPGAVALATGARCPQAYRLGELAWGIQFHAEVTLADFESWLDYHLADPGDGDGPADPEGLRVQTRQRIEGWNALGRALFARFLDQAELAGVRS